MKNLGILVVMTALILSQLSCSSDKPLPPYQKQSAEVSFSLVESSLMQQVAVLVLEVTVADQVVRRDTTELVNGAFEFVTFELPAAEATFVVRGLDASGRLLYAGTTTVTIQPGRENTIFIQLLPALPMVKLSPHQVDVFRGSPFTSRLELYNISRFASGEFRINYSPNFVRFDSVWQSNQAWGALSVAAEGGNGVIYVYVARLGGSDAVPPYSAPLLDIGFSSLAAGKTELVLEVDAMLDNQGTIQEMNSLYVDDQTISITSVSGYGGISGLVADPSRQPLGGAAVRLAGPTNRLTETRYDGSYSFGELPYGAYRITASKSGFLDDLRNLTLLEPALTLNLQLSDTLGPDQYRIVMTWGAQPQDLDAHLWTTIDDVLYDVHYNSQGSETAPPYAFLHHDEKGSFGTEVITVARLADTCRYAVYNFTKGRVDPGAAEITVSQALVTVYRGRNLVGSYGVPTSGSGLWWYVFDLLPSGALVIKNEVTDVNPGTGATGPPSGPKKQAP